MTAMAMRLPSSNVALVHDYMTQLGGAERVAGILATELSGADLFTSVHRPEQVPLRYIGGRAWQTSYLQPVSNRLPLKSMLALLPSAVASLDVRSELVLSSSSAFAHHVRPAKGAFHICYCATPAHFLWNQEAYFKGQPALAAALRPALSVLKRLDRAAAGRVDAYLANSKYTAGRIAEVYGREAQVVYPPVDMSRFEPSRERSGRFLVVSRLVRAKRVELAVEAANRYELPLDVIGDGPELRRLRAQAGPSVQILGWQPDDVVRRAMAECTAVIVAGEEDFGLVTAESQASGRPPIAFAAGGALEIIEDGVTGFLFRQQTVEALAEAMLRARQRDLEAADLRTSAERFAVPAFFESLGNAIDVAMSRRRMVNAR